MKTDTVAITRCKDCKFRGNARICPMCHTELTWDEDDGRDYYDVDRTEDDGFCHLGKEWEDDLESAY